MQPRQSPRRYLKLYRMLRDWDRRMFAAPSPAAVKHAVLLRHHIEGATWIETGTAQGNTTAVLARIATKVHTIEPHHESYKAAVQRFSETRNVEAYHGTSEEIFPKLLAKVSGTVCFWLDGHYSGGDTFQAQKDTPILNEMQEISASLDRFDRIAVLIDDIRCFDPDLPGFSDYPPLDHVVDWARENNLKWHIEHDIFVATGSGTSVQ